MEHQHKSGHAQGHEPKQAHDAKQMHDHYPRLYLMAALSFIAMFILMYAMVDRFANVVVNLNQVYMAGLMAAPMVVIEIALMSMMYPGKNEERRDRGGQPRRRHRVLGVDPPAGGDRQRAIPALDDPASRGRDPDVRTASGC